MLSETIHRLLTLYPRGISDRQLTGRLARAGLRVEPVELLESLKDLHERGEILRTSGGRWKAAELELRLQHSQPERPAAGAMGRLNAVPLNVELKPRSEPQIQDGEAEGGGTTTLPDWSQLLGYYAATQRQDPRGQIEEFHDRHGRGWQLVQMRGHWWRGARLRCDMNRLPADFQEALKRRKVEEAAAIGWPLFQLADAKGPSVIPGLLVPVSWKIDERDLIVAPMPTPPSLNPAWLKAVVRRTRWSEASLVEALRPDEEEEGELGRVGQLMQHALATIGGGTLRPAELDGHLVEAENRLSNSAGLFLPEDTTFTRGAARDLETLCGWSSEMRRGTALQSLWFEHVADPEPGVSPLSVRQLTDTQFDASLAGLGGPLTVIQGPPGTGKSEVILSFIASALLAGKSVLFASRNHQALDEVETRFRSLVGDGPVFTRGRDADGERDTNMFKALRDISIGHVRASHQADPLSDPALRELQAAARKGVELRQHELVRAELHLELSELADRRNEILEALAAQGSSGQGRRRDSRGIVAIMRFLLRLVTLRRAGGPLKPDASLAEVEARIARLRRQIVALPEPEKRYLDPEAVREALQNLAPAFALPLPEEQPDYLERQKELEFSGRRTARDLPEDVARKIVRLRPLWAMTTLSVPSRIPLVPALFDYAIFDEASQCDIASAMPLMARARIAIVVGDPMQLGFIPPLGRIAEHALMDAFGLPKQGRAAIAQSINSLFDFAFRRSIAHRFFLSDQFRSAPAIVDYLDREFYGGDRLAGRRPDEDFEKGTPSGYKPGLAWEDVRGRTARLDGGNINDAEVARIVALLTGFAADGEFDGSVGVIAPFNAQVGRIQQAVDRNLDGRTRANLKLKVATIDRFQGGECDVILFSVVVSEGAQRGAIDFLQKERRRLNVAISRARSLCIVVGNLHYARGAGIPHLSRLADRGTRNWSPPQEPFESGWERKLNAAMTRRGLKPVPQHPVGTRRIDLALDPEGARLAVEVDGRRWHMGPDGERKIADRLRDRELQARGWRVLHFWVHELEQDMEGCLDSIERALAERATA